MRAHFIDAQKMTHPEAITVSITRTVKTGCEVEFDRALLDFVQCSLSPQLARNTKIIDLAGRRVIPSLNDSHLPVIRGGLNFNLLEPVSNAAHWSVNRPAATIGQ
jgi:hypothetical protein